LLDKKDYRNTGVRVFEQESSSCCLKASVLSVGIELKIFLSEQAKRFSVTKYL